MRNIVDQEEQDRAEDASLCRDAAADTCADDPQSAPEECIAYACKRAHKSCLNSVDGLFVALFACILRFFEFFFHSDGRAGNESDDRGCRIKDRQVSLHGRFGLVAVGIKLFKGREHLICKSHVLHSLVAEASLQRERPPESLIENVLSHYTVLHFILHNCCSLFHHSSPPKSSDNGSYRLPAAACAAAAFSLACIVY